MQLITLKVYPPIIEPHCYAMSVPGMIRDYVYAFFGSILVFRDLDPLHRIRSDRYPIWLLHYLLPPTNAAGSRGLGSGIGSLSSANTTAQSLALVTWSS